MYPYVHCSIIYNSQDVETTQLTFNEWLDKEETHIYHGILLGHQRDEILPLATTQTDFESIMLSEKDKNCMISLICGI